MNAVERKLPNRKIIRLQEYEEIYHYILENPNRWEKDRFFAE